MSEREARTHAGGLRDWLMGALVGLVGLALTAGVFSASRNWERERLQIRFNQAATARALLLRARIDLQLSELAALARFYQGSRFVERGEFRTVVEPTLALHRDVVAYAWIPRVAATRIEELEQAARADGLQAYEVHRQPANEIQEPGATPDVVYPVHYVEPLAGNEELLGFDFGSDDTCRTAFEAARTTGTLAATARVVLQTASARPPVILIFMPVYRTDESQEATGDRYGHLQGFVSGAYDIRAGYAIATAGLESTGIDVRIVDESAPPGQRVLYADAALQVPNDPSGGGLDPSVRDSGLRYETRFTVGGRRWAMISTPSPEFLAEHHPWQSWIALAAGLLITSWATTHLVGTRRRTAHIAAVVEVRTAELQREIAERRRIEEALRRARDGLEAQVAEYERAQNALRESDARFRALVGNVPGVVYRCVCDEHWTMEYVSAAVETVTGYPPADFINNRVRSFASIIHPDDRGLVSDAILAAIARRQPYVIEYRVQHADGTARWVYEKGGQAVVTAEGVVTHLDGVILDITERKRAEEELAAYRADLEALVKERTAALETAQQELVRRERLAALGQLTASVSHEIRNPLGTIRNSFAVIRRDPLADKPGMKRALDRIDRNIVRCDTIIEELLDYTRTTQPTLTPTDIDRWLAEVLDEERMPEGITLTRSLAARQRVRCDRERLRRCVVNVLTNARQALEEDASADGRIHVATDVQDARVVIRFTDTGPGISPDKLPRVFEPLYSTKSFGVGLGLSIVKQTMEQHGGGVEIESAPGEGTEVALWLPRQADDPASAG